MTRSNSDRSGLSVWPSDGLAALALPATTQRRGGRPRDRRAADAAPSAPRPRSLPQGPQPRFDRQARRLLACGRSQARRAQGPPHPGPGLHRRRLHQGAAAQYPGPELPPEIAKIVAQVKPPEPEKPLANVADFLEAAKSQYGFVPMPTTERDFKRNYAIEALSVGLSKDQVVRIYALETGGRAPTTCSRA